MSLPVGAALLLATTILKFRAIAACRRAARRDLMFWVVSPSRLLLMGMPVAFADRHLGLRSSFSTRSCPPPFRSSSPFRRRRTLRCSRCRSSSCRQHHEQRRHHAPPARSRLGADGRMKGGLAQVSIALATLMGGVSGSAIADAAMQARMLGTEMLKRGFPRGYAAGVLSYGSLMTPIIPPGIGFHSMARSDRCRSGACSPPDSCRRSCCGPRLRSRSRSPQGRGYEPERKTRPTVKEVGKAMWGGLGAALPGVPAAWPALRHFYALRDRRVRRGVCLDRHVRVSRPQARLAQGGARGQLHRRRLGHAAARAVRVRLRHRVRARA